MIIDWGQTDRHYYSGGHFSFLVLLVTTVVSAVKNALLMMGVGR